MEETGCAKTFKRKRTWEQKKAHVALKERSADTPGRALWTVVRFFSIFWSTDGSS